MADIPERSIREMEDNIDGSNKRLEPYPDYLKAELSNAAVNNSLVYIWGQCKNFQGFYTDPKYANMEQAGLDPEYVSVLK